MFSRITPKKQAAQKSHKTEEAAYDSPLSELTQRLDRLKEIIEKTKNVYLESIQPETSTPSSSRRANLVNSLKRLGNIRGGPQQDTSATPLTSMASATSPLSQTSPASAGSAGSKSFVRRKTPDAQFIPMDEGEEVEVVEIIRRLAELVVVGERAAASAAEHNESLRKAAEKQHWGDDILEEQESVLKLKGRNIETDKYISLFENFFERNGLSLIVQIVTGASFASTYSTNSSHGGGGEEMHMAEVDHDVRLLPPLPIATQAVQSVSILVQNVSRATSLYFILSNNHVNQLIDFPLELYHVAERKKHNQENNGMSPRRFGSPELAELTTHFVTFLKSLALRMNVETLQFFLTYPTNENLEQNGKKSSSERLSSSENPQDVEDQPLDEVETNSTNPSARAEINAPVSVKEVQVCFPLYARALEFCAAHQDNFVRLTAMNICLNTLRLAVVTPDAEGDVSMDDENGLSPDGVLHNAKPLPFRIRLHIAQHVCAPSRVEGLVSPIFTKLAQLWGMLEEQFRAIEMSSASRTDVDGSTKEKVAKAKERARRQKLADSLNDVAASIQDELLLLEDVLKVN
jgi:hypothetical protein